MADIKTDLVLDAKGLACPMPIVKTKKAIGTIEPGQVLEVQATDKGSKADMKAWAESTGHQYIGTVEEGDLLKHYIRKARANEEKAPHSFGKVLTNDELKAKLGNNTIILDVRENAEYAFGHIPGAISVPLGELEDRLEEFNKDQEVYVVCHTGNRSDMAADKLSGKGFVKVYNVVPGMSEWDGPLEK
ncbi:sulfurtransferase TusA family protein [Heyndrickxia acidicola]|uniref:Sulfurtransferase TusA family protein n=1 Tax=Heyndrickxia acidicola TaxID=209389 RepID=A0ABU6MGZ3_9BACI|nr:sulfurtransferase TusA family protein [Heyndrickxia acidicola]MED1203937.1 sulfurtransferase TusA family protein [Heyndrickxia acidicola]